MRKKLIFLVMILLFVPPVVAYASEDERLEIYAQMLTAFGESGSFLDFMNEHAHTPRPDAEYIIDAADYAFVEGMEIRYYEGSVFVDEAGLIEWEFFVAEAGLYNISVYYYSVAGRSSNIQRAVFINGELPFSEANPVEFPRTWVNQLDYFQRDAQGNERRPTQIEQHVWREEIIRDNMGSFNEPLSFYFEAGLNTIGFFSQREPMLIRNIRVHQSPEVLPYAEVSAGFGNLPRPSVTNIEPIRIEGQYAVRKSSPMLAPQSDTAGPGVYPYSFRYIRINHIGGESWSEPGSWIEWEFDVEEAGLYTIALNTRQHFNRGAHSFRRISINGEVPFSEMEYVAFPFANGWQINTLGDDEPFLFWFDEGTHTIRMEAVLGGYAEFFREINEAVVRLNAIYRQIVMITGTSPETFRDYQIGRRLPHIQGMLMEERVILDEIFDSLTEMAVGRGERDAVIRSLARIMTIMYNDIEGIPQRLGHFRDNIGALGTWMMLVREQALSVDAIYILPYDAPTPDNGHRWWRQIWHEIMTLIFSFIIDFNTLPVEQHDGLYRNIEIWIGTGRDQANIVKTLIDETFSRDTGIGVTLMLVDMGTLLPATVAGQGPDIVLSVGNSTPMDFGMRGAVRDISGFPRFEEVTQRFHEAAMVPYTFDGMVFALPETITFPMLFYRRDILHEIGLSLPQTWDDVSIAIEKLAINHMDFGIPVGDAPLGSYVMFLYQMGGEIYNEDGSRSALDDEIAINAFRTFTRFFTDYELDREFDFANRFRLGEMPLAIADYSTYNMLQVFAPELRGRWGFTSVPGTLHPDGTIDRSVPAGGSAVIMMEAVNDPDAAWEFMKWWTSADIQTQFGREMESLMGAAARHPTANLEAFARMPWPIQDYRSLQNQFQYVRGIPEVPGGYFTPRQVRNAFFTTVELGTISPRDSLVDSVRRINDELRAKRREFGID